MKKRAVQKCGTSAKKLPLEKQFKSPFKTVKEKSEVTVPDLKKELETLQAKQKQIETDVKELEACGYKESELQTHIEKLHEYNEIKDVGQMVLGRIASIKGVQTKDLYEEYGLNLDD